MGTLSIDFRKAFDVVNGPFVLRSRTICAILVEGIMS